MATLTQPTLLDAPRPSLLDTIAAEREAVRGADRNGWHGAAPAAARAAREAPAAGGPTLEDLVTGAWSALRAGESAACLACGAAMTPRYGAGHHALGGRCGGCGSELA